MNILLDTHIWLWTLLDEQRVGKHLGTALQDPANELWLCSISIWEAMLLFEKGAIKLPGAPAVWIRQSLAKGFVAESPVSNEIALESRGFDLPH